MPVCAIGGINKNNIKLLLTTGVDMVAVINALFATDAPKQAAEELLQLIHQFN